MDRVIKFYLDFVSPFSYLALQRLPGIAERFGYKVSFKAVDLAELKRLAGNSGPPTREIPIKLRYARIDLARWARSYQVPMATPPRSDSSLLNRGTSFAAKKQMTRDYVTLAFRKIWGEGGHMADVAQLRGIAHDLGWDSNDFVQL
jgi:2-hydroxychromene-2-carboxylate isomerase